MATHAASVGVLAAGTSALWSRAMDTMEAGAAEEEDVLGTGEQVARWSGPTLSGGPGSLVPWSTLGKEGRRHMATHVRAAPVVDRPTGVPDLSIETVLGQPALATPVQVFVGLDSAPTMRERVDLALAEMERTGAFDRSLLVLVSPTGLGYVNYVAMAAAQYLTRGDIASVRAAIASSTIVAVWRVRSKRRFSRSRTRARARTSTAPKSARRSG